MLKVSDATAKEEAEQKRKEEQVAKERAEKEMEKLLAELSDFVEE